LTIAFVGAAPLPETVDAAVPDAAAAAVPVAEPVAEPVPEVLVEPFVPVDTVMNMSVFAMFCLKLKNQISPPVLAPLVFPTLLITELAMATSWLKTLL
jgi:hypothetical protein